MAEEAYVVVDMMIAIGGKAMTTIINELLEGPDDVLGAYVKHVVSMLRAGDANAEVFRHEAGAPTSSPLGEGL